MKRPTPTQFAAYQQIFDYFNLNLFENSLQHCMLNFGKHPGSHAFSADQWREESGMATSEISLNVRQMSKGQWIEVMATLVRAMVHLWQEKYGHPSRSWYYNREWAEKMKETGLTPTATGLPGGKETGQGIKHYIEENGRFEQAFLKMPSTYALPFRPAEFEKRERTSLRVRYQCTGCGTKVWGKGGLGLVCECGNVFAGEKGDAKMGLEEKVYKLLGKRFG